MTSISSITKQLFINRLILPQELQTTIKSYCFYDVLTWKTIQFIKSKKNRIHHLLNTACLSRANHPINLYPFGSDTEEHWVFYVYNEEDGGNQQFQANNCSLCGEYKMTGSRFILPERIQCKCPVEDDYYYHSSDDDSFDD
jgi:hypothetical protein